jgi:hypothetical protein
MKSAGAMDDEDLRINEKKMVLVVPEPILLKRF